MRTISGNERDDLIRELTRRGVAAYSGGMKFTELVAYIASMAFDRKISSDSFDADAIEHVIFQMPDVKVLEYTCHVSSRTKMFVYTP